MSHTLTEALSFIMASDPGKERRPMSLTHLHDTIVSGQDALKRLAQALDALHATARASSR